MHKIIHSKFELDLSSFNLTTVKENYWFSDQFFTKYSYPAKMKLTETLIKVFGYFLDDTNQFNQTLFNVVYVKGSKTESAIFEITNQEGVILDFTIRFGFDELPNWDKNLRDLPLEYLEVEDINVHAKSIITQTWPAVNYNYPQIHTEKYDVEEEAWTAFGKIINRYASLNFPINTFTAEDFANRNIIQPLPHLLHVLITGFADAGYTLKGDILSNELVQKILIFVDTNYYNLINEAEQNIIINNIDYVEFISPVASYYQEASLYNSKKYKVTGKAHYTNFSDDSGAFSYVKISYKGIELFSKSQVSSRSGFFTYDINFEFDTNSDDDATQLLMFEASAPFHYRRGVIFDVKIERILEDGSKPTDEIHLLNKVDLSLTVPDMTFGNLVTEVKKEFNIGLEPVGSDIYMNFIEDEVNYKYAVNLSAYEKMLSEVKKEFKSGNSYLLKYKDVDSEDYSYDVAFQNKDEIVYNDESVDDDTEEIELNALPLPQKNIDGIETAFDFENGGDSELCFVLYAGLNENELNLTEDSNELLIPNIHETFYKSWFNFRLNAVSRIWTFLMHEEELDKIKKKIYAYSQFHIVKSIEESEIDKELYSVEIEVESLP